MIAIHYWKACSAIFDYSTWCNGYSRKTWLEDSSILCLSYNHPYTTKFEMLSLCWLAEDRSEANLKVIFATPILKFLLTFLVVFVSLFHIFKTIYHKTDHPVLPLAMFFIVIFSDTDVRILLLNFRAFIFLLCSLVLFLTILLLDDQIWEDPFLLSHPFPPHLNLIPYLGGFGNKCALLTLGDMLSCATLYQKKAVPTIFRNGQDRCLQSKSAKENSNT